MVPIPTNQPMVRIDQPDLIYKTELAKFEAVVEDIVERHDKGQPVLVGTASVEKSEVLAGHARPSGASRTTSSTPSSTPGRRRSSPRPAACTPSRWPPTWPGEASTSCSAATPRGWPPTRSPAAGLDPDSEEGQARYSELLAKFEDECKAEGDKIRELGGLYVLGSERHESRRIDNQLRGRAGRQGDPGESRFFLSLEDELMRLFATGAMKWVMGRALPEDVPIDSKMVSKAIERAQNTVEARNAEIRKDVLKYDEVMNEQRKVIYARRMQILEGEDLRARTVEVLSSALDSTITANCATDFTEDWNLDGLLTEARQYFPTTVTREQLEGIDPPRRDLRAAGGRGHRLLRAARGGDARGRGDHAGPRARGHAAADRPEVAGAPLGDGLPPRGHQPAGHGPEGPAGRVAARRLRDVRPADVGSVDDDYVKIVMHAQVQVLEQARADDGTSWPGPSTRRPTTRCRGPAA